MPSKLLQSCPTPCNAMDSSPPGSSVHGIYQARVLEWAAIAFSKYYYKGIVIDDSKLKHIDFSLLF